MADTGPQGDHVALQVNGAENRYTASFGEWRRDHGAYRTYADTPIALSTRGSNKHAL